MFRYIAFSVCALVSSNLFAVVSNFEDKTLSPNSVYNGSDLAGGFVSQGVHYSNSYDSTFSAWSGFAYSNVADPTTPGFANQYAAITGTGSGGGGIYSVVFDVSAFGPQNVVTLPYVASVQSMRITNTTYAFYALRDGNDGFGAVRQFGNDPNVAGAGNQGYPDWFKVTIVGRDAANQITGSIDHFLADYRFVDNAGDFVANVWDSIDLTSLGNVKSLAFSLSSSDVGIFGMNTPAYFALDDVTFVPEPQVLGLMVVCAGYLRRR